MRYNDLVFADHHHRVRRGDEQFALRQIVDLALRHNVRKLVGLGDLIDRQTNRSETILGFYQEVSGLAGNCDFWFIQGQHDFDVPPWLTQVGVHAHGSVFEVGPWTCYGLDFQPVGKLREALDLVPADCDCLLCHQTWGDWMGDVATTQGDFADVPGHVKVVLTGDLHRCVVEKHKNRDGEQMRTISPGATTAQKIDEPHEHYVLLVGDDGSVKKEKLKSRVFIDGPVMNRPDDLDRFVAELPAELDAAYERAAAADYPHDMMTPILRYTFSHRLADAVRRVERAAAGRAFLYEKELPPDEKRAPAVRGAQLGDDAVTPLSVLASGQVELPKPEDEVRELTQRLLQAGPGYKEEFRRWWAETTEDPPEEE
jgi:predicted phosphodiesterase